MPQYHVNHCSHATRISKNLHGLISFLSALCLWILPPMLQKCNSILHFPLWKETLKMFHWQSSLIFPYIFGNNIRFFWYKESFFYSKRGKGFGNEQTISMSSVEVIANHSKNRISDALSASLLNPVFTGWCFLHFITQFMCWINSNSQSFLNATGPNASHEGLS